MRTIKLILLAVILLAVVILALANRDPVTVRLLPAGLDRLAPGAVIELPLFVLGLLAIVVGIVLGYLFEYLREYKHRRRAAEKAREASRLSREMDRLRRETNKPEDEVLALIGR